jgi:uncharacterized protein (DUF2147 family)
VLGGILPPEFELTALLREVSMKVLYLAVALALLSTSADAAVREFKFGGRTVRIDIPKNCKKISCMSLSEKEKPTRKGAATDTTSRAPAAAAVGTAAAAATGAPGVAKAEDKPVETVQRDAVRSEPKSEPEADERRSVARLTLPSNTVEEPRRAPVQTAAAPANEDEPKAAPKAANSPLGLWITEKNEGRVRIEECGANLCGYAVESNGQNGKKVLIDMKPGGNRWNGRIHDVKSGRIYTSHMSLRGSNGLRVEGCAFGGLFCGGQTWKRAE